MTAQGGSPYQIFQNETMRVAKQVAQPQDLTARGTLTKEAMQRVRNKCREEWVAMEDADKQQYKVMYEARLAARRASTPPSAAGAANVDLARHVGHWRCGAERFVLHPKFLQEAFAAGARLPGVTEAPWSHGLA